MDKEVKSPDDFIAMVQSWGIILATEHACAEKVNHYSLGEEVKKLTKGNRNEFIHQTA